MRRSLSRRMFSLRKNVRWERFVFPAIMKLTNKFKKGNENTALMRPDPVEKVIADSFDGRSLADDFSKNLLKERAFAKGDSLSRQFYEWCQGSGWETVVDRNTEALVECAERKLPLFHEPLGTLSVPILFSGSLEDTMYRKDMAEEYRQMERLVPKGRVHLFPTGGHPAMPTNVEAFADLAKDFFRK